MDYKIVKDNRRKRMTMTVSKDGAVVITVPKWTRKANIERFYRQNTDWIAQRRQEIRQDRDKYIRLSPEDIRQLKAKARTVMTSKTLYYGKIMGVMPDKIKITSAQKSWGTCIKNKTGYNICYSYRNMFLSDKAQDYIVVHELAHILHFDHSKAFYAEIEKVLPDWRTASREADNYKDYHIY